MPKLCLPAYKRVTRSAASLVLTAVLAGSALPASASQVPGNQLAGELPSGSSRIECISFMFGVYPCAVGEQIVLWPQTNSPEDAVLTYEWFSNGKLIPGATASSFVPSDEYLGKSISAKMIVTWGQERSVRESNVLPPLLGRLTDFPDAASTRIDGSGLAGQPLTAVPAPYPAGTIFKYQWRYQVGTSIIPIPGATGKTYTPTADLDGKPVSVAVIVTKPGYRDRFTGFAWAVTVHAKVVDVPMISWNEPGTWTPLVQGNTVRAEVWESGAVLTYQWNRGGKPIPGATGSTYRLGAADYDQQISVTVTGTMDGYPTASATSEPTAKVGREKLYPTELPDVTGYDPRGLFVVNGTAKAFNGVWNTAPTAYTYQWLSNGNPIAGATRSTYKISQQVLGTSLSLRISATKADYETHVYTTQGRPVGRPLDPPVFGGPTPAEGPFADVPAGMQFSHEIEWMAIEGISLGWPDNTYRPFDVVARDAMSAFMYRLADSPSFTTPATSPFKDVAERQQFFTEMSWLSTTGVSTGWPDGTFRALTPVNRDAMAAFLYRLAGSPAFTAPVVSPYADVSTTNLFYKEISWLAAQEISTGWVQPGGTRLFKPGEPVRRDAMAAFMYRFDQKGYKLPASH